MYICLEYQSILHEKEKKTVRGLRNLNSQSKRSLTSVTISNRINSELHRYWLATIILPESFSDTFPTTNHGWLKKSMILNTYTILLIKIN